MRYTLLFIILSFLFLISCNKNTNEPEGITEELTVTYIVIGKTVLTSPSIVENISLDEIIEIRFNIPVNTASAKEHIALIDASGKEIELSFTFFNENKLIKIAHPVLVAGQTYTITISDELKGEKDELIVEQSFVFSTQTPPLILQSLTIDQKEINPAIVMKEISREPIFELHFNTPVDKSDIMIYSSFVSDDGPVDYTINTVDDVTISIRANQILQGYRKYILKISTDIENRIGIPFDGMELTFYTTLDSTLKFPVISDEELLTLIQKQTFKYFWDLTSTQSGMNRERYQPSNTNTTNVTFGGSGFGLMAIIVGIERGFITREEGVDRWKQITNFIENKAATFHGVWPHWMNGNTGAVNKFSPEQDGGDLIETSFMIQGLLTVRQYLNPDNPVEAELIASINRLWEAVEWDFFKQEGDDALTWNWSPTNGFLNLRIRGWNEGLIAYVLAASSPSHPIPVESYTKGWARDGGIVNSSGKTYFNFKLPLRTDMGGPLFFTHYSFLGLDPSHLSDQYANYWEQNVTHAKINHAYCSNNPLAYVGYSDVCWGLTASDGYSGYSAHSPDNDRGVISPTAAVSSLPYTPEESMAAIRHFYYILGDKLWGEYGFQDAFDFTNNWVDDNTLAIDQGPQIIMIENYRTGLLWDLFMSAPEIQSGLTKLGFTY